ncbi:MAG TPA: hypothetical protein VEL76_31735, partial [Gemmataceae bacterium]|nr:hypothetical protein [Gemmataceae bacterium]
MDQLMTSLLDLLGELEGRGIALMVGGGFGLYLKRLHLAGARERTLLDRLPEPRATNDLDLFLRAEVLADLDRTRAVADAIRHLGYVPVAEAKFLQWKRQIVVAGVVQEVKIDVLVGPLGEFGKCLKINKPRVRPKGSIEFHAHMVEEALDIEGHPVTLSVSGRRSTGEPHRGTVLVPAAFPYLMMKLHAFDDRKDDADRNQGRHHALDLYTIVGMMTETEYERARALGDAHGADKHVERARRIVRDHFGERTALGMLRLQEHKLFRDDFLVGEFMEVVGEIFRGVGVRQGSDSDGRYPVRPGEGPGTETAVGLFGSWHLSGSIAVDSELVFA